ncbi:DUF2911 domain-containing protein [bacterium]|nr:DUF2911 domain-containing protein [bacterium]
MKMYLSAVLALIGIQLFGQEQKPSPAREARGMVDGVEVVIQYNAPSVKGRKIFGGLVPFGEVWRTGANENTTIEFKEALKVGDQIVKPGKYGLFTIPGEKTWTWILNVDNNNWGAYKYKQNRDVMRQVADATTASESTEQMTFLVDDSGIELRWANTSVRLPMSAAK